MKHQKSLIEQILVRISNTPGCLQAIIEEVTVDLKLCCPRTDYGLVLVII